MIDLRLRTVLPWLIGILISVPAEGSDPIGIYALVEKVVLEPNAENPERIQVWGAFALAEGHQTFGDYYHPPVRGYLYFRIPEGKKEQGRQEWSDLKSVAGTGQCIGFASRYEKKGTLRKPDQLPENPDPYPLGFGMRKLSKKSRNQVATLLRRLPNHASR